MNKSFDKLPEIKIKSDHNKHVGIIGCGKFPYSILSYYLKKNYGKVRKGAMDIEIKRAVSLFQ